MQNYESSILLLLNKKSHFVYTLNIYIKYMHSIVCIQNIDEHIDKQWLFVL